MPAILLQTDNLKSIIPAFAAEEHLEVSNSPERQTCLIDMALVRRHLQALVHLFPASPLPRQRSLYRVSMWRTSLTPTRESEQPIPLRLADTVNGRYNGSRNSRIVSLGLRVNGIIGKASL
jgi:hypothetical protein